MVPAKVNTRPDSHSPWQDHPSTQPVFGAMPVSGDYVQFGSESNWYRVVLARHTPEQRQTRVEVWLELVPEPPELSDNSSRVND